MTARRTCEQCGSLMPAYVPRRTVGGRKVCEGCQKWHNKTSMTKVAQLENPIHKRTGKDQHDWFHGSKHEFHEFGDPEDHSPLQFEDNPEDTSHWNTLLGNHFTSDHQVAADFAEGHHSSAANSNGAESGRVIHTKLHLKNPKVYASEHDMDQEVHEFEHARGNTIDSHFPPPSEAETKDWDEYDWEDHHAEMGRAKHYANDSEKPFDRDDPDPAQPYSGHVHPKSVGWLNSHPDKYNIAARFKQRLKDAGHDGIVYGNEYEMSNHGKQATSAIAFHPHQIEITQDHTVNKNCLKPGDLARRPGPGQEMIPGTEHMPQKRPFHPVPGKWTHPVTWHDPKMWRESKMTPHGVDWGRLTAPLPQECWDRYHGRQSHTAAKKHTYTVQRYAPQGGYETVEKEIEGPLYHGGRGKLNEGDLITPGRKPNSWGDEGPKSTHVYFSTDRDTAASYSQQLGNKGHLYEVEPTGEFRTDYGPQDYKTPHPLRVVRKIPREEWQLGSTTAAHGEQSALNHAGQQDVYPVSTSRGITPMCQYHLNVHQSISQGANDLAGHLGIPEAPVEPLGGSEKGTCAECFKNTGYQLKLNRPEGYDRQQQRDSKQPRTRKDGPYLPAKTKPLIVLRQSQNAKSVVSGSSDNGSVRALRAETDENGVIMGSNRRAPGQRLDHLRASEFVQVVTRLASEKPTFYYHGSNRDTEVSEDGRDETLHPAGGALHLHPDEGTAWKHAIKAWDKHAYGVDSFPRVYRVSHRDLPSDAQPTAGGGLTTHQPLTNPGRATYNPEKHPPIRGRYEEGPILYHGTSHHHDPEDYTLDQHEPLEEILPASRTGRGPTFASNIASPDHAYASKGLRSAWSYADTHAMETGGVPHVYRVTPHNPEDLEEDPKENEHGQSRGNNDDDMRSKSGFQVLGEVPMSRQLREYHTPERDEDDDDDWGDSHYGVKVANEQHHDFKEPIKAMSNKKLPSLRQIVAHDATENQEIRHCPMCGGGKIIGRQDGSVECEYCHSYFTVQIQPQFPNFPQTIDGMPQQIPGMPGQVETPPGASVPGQELPPGEEGAEDPAAGGNPFADGDADDAGGPPDGDADDAGGDEPPPFAKKSFKTVTGALLDEDTYARHLAIRLAPDRAAMIALIRQEQGAR